MPTNYPALLKLLRIHPNRLPIILTMAPWEPTLHDLENLCPRFLCAVFSRRRLYPRCNWLQDARVVKVEGSTLCAEDASNVAGKKNIAEEKTRFHTGRPNHDSGPFWPQLGPVVFLAVIFLINFIARIILSPLLPTIEKELAISHGQAGSFFFLISGGYVIGLLGSGFLASRSSHKITIVISTAGVGLALLGISVVSSLWAMRVGLFGLGFAGGLYIPSAIATITSLIERPHWGKAIAVHELAPNLAFFAGPFVAELFLSWSTWRLALSSLGMASLVASFAYFRFGRGGEFAGESPASSAFGLLVRCAFVLDHGRAVWLGRKLHDRCLCHAAALPCKRAAGSI